MGVYTGTAAVNTEFSGTKKLVTLTASMTDASGTITIDSDSHGISSFDAIVGCVITGGLDAAFTNVQAARTNSTTITLTAVEQDGTAATDFTGTTVAVSVIGS